MIVLTHLDGKEFVLNADQILTLEDTPDTLITTVSGAHMMVREAVEVVVARVMAWRRGVLSGPRVVED
ncbi:MAG TPA: flagellar FlbD family protein [Myxococcales bacterium]|nr:flagellar FlbD family protein [Myxococcales bacterium]